MKALQKIINERKRESFVDPVTTPDEEALGVVIASHFEWDGLAILRTAMYALEDANFHTEAGLVQEWIDKIEAE